MRGYLASPDVADQPAPAPAGKAAADAADIPTLAKTPAEAGESLIPAFVTLIHAVGALIHSAQPARRAGLLFPHYAALPVPGIHPGTSPGT